MQSIFSTAEVPPRHRYDYWHEIACRRIIEHDGKPEDPGTFEGEIRAGFLIDIGVLEWSASPLTIDRTTRHIGHARNDDLIFLRLTAGNLSVEQDGRQTILKAGDMILLDPRLPHRSGFLKTPRAVFAMTIPRRYLEARIGLTRQMLGRASAPSSRRLWRRSLITLTVLILPTKRSSENTWLI
jgi:hypothetical protein